MLIFVVIIFCGFFAGSTANVHDEEIVLRLRYGGVNFVRQLARRFGFIFKGEVRGFANTYVLIPKDVSTASVIGYPGQKRGVVFKLQQDHRVAWIEKQKIVKRVKRDDYNNFYFNDELWNRQWYLQDRRRKNNDQVSKLDLNVIPVYKMGITGKNVRIVVLDDGIEYTHRDLSNNYDPEISYDCNEEDLDPLPRYDLSKSNNHGTRCAGEIAMVANNGKCGVGVAFDSKIGGIKILDGSINDRIEGIALSHAFDLVDVYSASWGPSDDGATLDGPGTLALEALKNGIKRGRKGLGSIYVWASGNGGANGDNCNCDGYANSIYTITVGSASEKGLFPWYGEECASILTVTYSSGAYEDRMVATTDLNDTCTLRHTGTSASAPLAAGIIALLLEINPSVTWRDVQHLIASTSDPGPLWDNPGWKTNAQGLHFNTRFGFGLMNAEALVEAARNWIKVPDKIICEIRIVKDLRFTSKRRIISYGSEVEIEFEDELCEIAFLEHVEVRAKITYSRRGALEISLSSPSGTKVQLLGRRKRDESREGFKDWTFMSVMTWGESSRGIWTIKIKDQYGPFNNSGELEKLIVYFHGIVIVPEYYR